MLATFLRIIIYYVCLDLYFTLLRNFVSIHVNVIVTLAAPLYVSRITVFTRVRNISATLNLASRCASCRKSCTCCLPLTTTMYER